jgi:hypothetical protein
LEELDRDFFFHTSPRSTVRLVHSTDRDLARAVSGLVETAWTDALRKA